MSHAQQTPLEPPWHRILRDAGVVLQSDLVGVFEADQRGGLRPIVTVPEHPAGGAAIRELEDALRRWNVPRPPGQRWVAARLPVGRWCVAPIRREPRREPAPSPVERRGPERMTLEVAGLCIGLIEDLEYSGAQVHQKALHDPLTGLPNRAFFMEQVSRAVERARRDPGYRFAVLFLDLDRFKVINDSLGHAAGDQLLQLVAARLEMCTRGRDLVARLGGDEFTLLLEEPTTVTDLEHAARRIQVCLAAPFVIEGREIFVTASIGGAVSAAAGSAPRDMVRDADLAMYRAKTAGPGRFQVFSVAMRKHALQRFGLEADLRGAIERGELRLVFQPIVYLASGRVHAFEALLRWHHPKRGTLLPADFIPLAEETGMIIPIGKWVLREALWHARRWHRGVPGGDPIQISVNVSAKQLADPGIVDDVRDVLHHETVEPRRVQLEITESVLVENIDASAARLQELRALGVELHMDDFGTGYASLSYLPRLPLQTIKIDRSFTQRLGHRRSDQQLVRAIVDLARTLGMGVIAEGVETPHQRERLIAFGCELGQGFHFAKPLDFVAAGAMLEATRRSPRD